MVKRSCFLSAPLGDHLVLARPGPQPGQRLQVLDPMATWIWQNHKAGLSLDQIALELATHFDVPLGQARDDVANLARSWSELPASRNWSLRLADRYLALKVDDPLMADHLGVMLEHLATAAERTPDTRLNLGGTPSGWYLTQDGGLIAAGQTLDAALVQTRAELVEAGCHVASRLLVLHAAGVSRDDQGILLIGKGGAGKTTLATALNARGWALLSDDTIPVTLDGKLLGVGLGPCLKAGSWPILAPFMPDLERCPVIQRMGQTVHLTSPPGPTTSGPLTTALFLVPCYQPDVIPRLESLSPVQVLEAILAAESVLPILDQARLATLTTWVASAPGFRLIYPSLEEAIALIEGLVDS